MTSVLLQATNGAFWGSKILEAHTPKNVPETVRELPGHDLDSFSSVYTLENYVDEWIHKMMI